jgi:adenosylcobinamide-phosphate synthase
LVLDALWGEPPASVHPVVWMGRLLDWLETRAPRSEAGRLTYGLGIALGGPLVWGGLGWLVERLAPWPLRVLALKATFAGRCLLQAGRRVEDSLRNHDLDRARAELMWLVSRPTAELDAPLIAAAAIESLAENLVDSVVAPLLAYWVGGLAGAYAYRAANTADAMWGYRTPAYASLGRAAAKLDDVLNWLPARVGALLLVMVGPRRGQALYAWRQNAARTASPNAGQPMAAAAGQLGVRLEKPGHYTLHAVAPPPSTDDVAGARRLVGRAMLTLAGLMLLLTRARARG